jgi:hypothetical protein
MVKFVGGDPEGGRVLVLVLNHLGESPSVMEVGGIISKFFFNSFNLKITLTIIPSDWPPAQNRPFLQAKNSQCSLTVLSHCALTQCSLSPLSLCSLRLCSLTVLSHCALSRCILPWLNTAMAGVEYYCHGWGGILPCRLKPRTLRH